MYAQYEVTVSIVLIWFVDVLKEKKKCFYKSPGNEQITRTKLERITSKNRKNNVVKTTHAIMTHDPCATIDNTPHLVRAGSKE